jgi:hypothetical protein
MWKIAWKHIILMNMVIILHGIDSKSLRIGQKMYIIIILLYDNNNFYSMLQLVMQLQRCHSFMHKVFHIESSNVTIQWLLIHENSIGITQCLIHARILDECFADQFVNHPTEGWWGLSKNYQYRAASITNQFWNWAEAQVFYYDQIYINLNSVYCFCLIFCLR